MEIKDFEVEQWMNLWETKCTHNVAETCVYSLSLDQLFELTGGDKQAFLDAFAARRLTYGDIEGRPDLLSGIAKLYRTVAPEHIIPTHGAAGANALVLSTLVNPGDHVVSVMPTYQQLYSIPEMCGAAVDVLHLEKENGYHVDVEALDALCTPETKVICINNPDNPTGALLDGETLRAIVEVARKNDAWLHCDEVYRHLNQTDEYAESVVDLYDKGVTTSSMSKVWSLAGIRLGWCVTKDEQLRRDLCPIATTTSSPAACSTRPRRLRAGPCRRHPRPQPPYRAREFGYAFGMGGIGAAPVRRSARGRHDGARLLRLRHPLLRFLHRYGEVQRCLRHAGRLLRGAEELSRGLRLLRRYGQLSEQRRDRARTG